MVASLTASGKKQVQPFGAIAVTPLEAIAHAQFNESGRLRCRAHAAVDPDVPSARPSMRSYGKGCAHGYKYCHRWDTASGTPIDPISQEEAEWRFRGEVAEPDHWFSIVASKHAGVEGAAPEYLLEVLPRASNVNVKFRDSYCNERYGYGFTRIVESLFMGHVTEHSYPVVPQHYGLNEAVCVAEYLYKPDGCTKKVLMDDSDPLTHMSEYRDVDVSKHWEPVPEFGAWGSLGKFNRW